MRTIPPAETFIINELDKTQSNSNKPPTPKQVEECMIEFAKMHVTEALKQASEKAEIENDWDNQKGNISKDSILTAYPLDNIT